jgi:hypothetical protein
MVYSVRPVDKPAASAGWQSLRYWLAIPIALGLIALLSGCVIHPPHHGHGYYGGYGRGYGYSDRVYRRGYDGYGRGGGWGRHHHHDD